MKRILVATDFSTRSDRALRRAVLIAGQCGAGLTLVHVVDDDQPAFMIDRERAAASELLGQSAATIVEVDKVAADAVVATGDAFDGILRVADEIDADLILVGPHRRQFLDIFVGTTAERTIRRSRRPVLMANAVPSEPYHRTLLAIDFDDASRSAVETAGRLGIVEETDVVALHLFDAPAAGMMKRAGEVPDAVDHYVEGEERRAREELAAFLAASGLPRYRQRLGSAQGSPAAAILAAADAQDADLIVIGTNQRKGLERLLLGSVAEKLLVDAKRDVLVVPAAAQAAAEGP